MKKKGFTLVELLAVIVVLAIIALIAIPQVSKILQSSKKAAFTDSVLSLSSSIESYLLKNNLSDIPEEGINVQDLDVKSKKFTGKFIKEDGKISAYFISDGTYCAYGEMDNLIVEKDCSRLDSTPPEVDETKIEMSSTTNSIKIKLLENFAEDIESGIKSIQINLYKEDKVVKTQNVSIGNEYVLDGLIEKETYKIEIIVTNKNNMKTKVEKTVTMNALGTVTLGASSPSGYAQSKTVKITYSGNGTYLLKPSVDVTTDVEATTCSSVTYGAYTCTGTSISASGTLKANTWYQVTSNPTLTFTSNGTVDAKVADGTNYVNGTATTVANIDTTAPTSASFTTGKTTNSITVTASGTDNESNIAYYQFSKDGGSTWYPSSPQTSNTYTFTGLSSGTYSIKVRVMNGTYDNNGQNEMNTTESTATSVTTSALGTVTLGTSSPSGYAQSKTVKITYSGNGTYLLKPSVDVTTNVSATTCSSVTNGSYTCSGTSISANGTLKANTWYKVTSNPTLTFTSNGTVDAKVADGTNYVNGTATTVANIDTTAPTNASFTTSQTTNSITVTASGTDNESNIAYYQFSKDGGSTWYPSGPQTSKTYTFSGLSLGTTYSIKVKVYNGTYPNNTTNNSLASDTKTVTLTLQVGDYVKMTPTSTSYTIAKADTGCTSSSYCGNGTDQTIKPSELTLWRVIRVNDDKTYDAVSVYTSSTTVEFYGQTGYQKLVGTLNAIAKQYENSNYTTGSRMMGYNGQTETITVSLTTSNSGTSSTLSSAAIANEAKGSGDLLYTTDTDLVNNVFGTKVANQVGTTTATTYWLASRYYSYGSSANYRWYGRYVYSSGSIGSSYLYDYSGGWNSYSPANAVRPIITLKSGLNATGSGSSSSPYVLK
jgi:prepilin-type N-terminal cleavage/methylation domain-containing protein